jgi:hypothetical protein
MPVSPRDERRSHPTEEADEEDSARTPLLSPHDLRREEPTRRSCDRYRENQREEVCCSQRSHAASGLIQSPPSGHEQVRCHS